MWSDQELRAPRGLNYVPGEKWTVLLMYTDGSGHSVAPFPLLCDSLP